MRIRVLTSDELMTGRDHIVSVVAEDSAGRKVMSMSATVRAEVHMESTQFGTPGARWELLQAMHDVMERELKARGVQRVWSWFENPGRFCKRLLSLKWCKSDATLFYREVR